MKSYEKNRAPHVIFGCNAINDIVHQLKQYNVKKCLIVTTSGMVKRGSIDAIKIPIESNNIECGIFDKVIPDPPDYLCMEVRDIIRANQYDCVIGFGGGSTMDTAKVGCLIAGIDEDIQDLHEYSKQGTLMNESYKRPAILILVPTTSGSGAESTATGVISSSKQKLKYSIGNENAIADVAIIDPLLTLNVPQNTTLNSGMDILAHSLENVIGVQQSEFTNILMLKCIEKVWKWLPVASDDLKNLEAREQLAWASHNAESNGGLPNGHAVAHAIGALYNMPHGHACAVTLPTVVRHFGKSTESAESICKIAEVIGVAETDDNQTNADRIADAVLTYYKKLGLLTLSEYLKKNNIHDSKEAFIEKAIPLVMDDFKSRLWNPPIHTGDYRNKISHILEMIYDEK